MSIVKDWRKWFGFAWRNEAARSRVLEGYVELGRLHPALITDIALRNNVFDDTDPPTDPVALGIYMGRRLAALEIIKLAGKEPTQLMAFHASTERTK